MTGDDQRLRKLMLAGIAGDSQAQTELLSALAVRLRSYFRNRGMTPSDGEDLVQETLIAVHTKRSMYDPAQPLLAWVHAIARYRLIDRYRREKKRGVQVPVEDWSEALAGEAPEAGDPARDVARLLDQLPDKQRRSIELVKLQEKSVAEAASLTGWSQSDIKVSIHRGMKLLQRLVSDRAPHSQEGLV
ncbi:MAG: sigma-70 family RNA polymerase sigma factor [Hyphomonadaceae bacterium]|nr:sigma-70 family RNA polymerase sigma factor [Hyphomonadaceae bacterium]